MRRIILTVISVLISFVQFILFSSVALGVYEVFGGYRAFIALISIILLGMVEVAFIILIFKYYSSLKRTSIRGFLRASAIQMLFFPIIDALRFFLFRPLHRTVESSFRAIQIRDFIVGGGGLILAVILFLLVVCMKRKKDH